MGIEPMVKIEATRIRHPIIMFLIVILLCEKSNLSEIKVFHVEQYIPIQKKALFFLNLFKTNPPRWY